MDPDPHRKPSTSCQHNPVKAVTPYIHKAVPSALLHGSIHREFSTLLSTTSWGLLSNEAPPRGQSWQLRIFSFPTCYDCDQCPPGSCASPALLWQSHPGTFSQLQLYASGFFLPLLLSPSSLLELVQRSSNFLLLYPDINILFYLTTPWG